MESNEYWNDQGGSICGMPPGSKVFYENHYEYMSHHANKGVEVEHDGPSFDYQSLMYTVNRREISHR